MILFYRIALFLYAVAIRIASLFKPKAKLFVDGRKGLLLQIKAKMGAESRPRIWMHCASLGEFEQGRPVLEALRDQYPAYAIVLTFFSPSGYQVRKKYKGADYVFYLPMDSASNAKQFVLDIDPALVLFVKYDLWYYYLHELQKKQIRVVLIDAIFRPQQGYFRWFGSVQREMLGMLDHIFVQNQDSIDLLNKIKIHQASVAGDTRFDRVISVAQAAAPIEKIALVAAKNKLLIAGSTWIEDEALLASVLPSLPKDWKLIIVPHEVDETRISSIEKLFQGNVKRWSLWQDNSAFAEQVLVVDTIGLLLKMYRYATIAWIGGGLGKAGVHNILEAAVYGLPCAFGPVYEKYLEAIELIEQRAAVSCTSASEFLSFFETMQNETAFTRMANAARNYVGSKAGATSVILDYVAEKNWLRIL